MNSKLELRHFTPYRLSVLSNGVSDFVAESYRDEFRLTRPEWRILAVVGEIPDISADEIADYTRMEKSIVSRAINKLIQRDFLHREFDSSDRRRSRIKLSQIGQAIYKEIVPRALICEKKLLDCFSSAEYKQFSKLIEKLNNHVQGLSASE